MNRQEQVRRYQELLRTPWDLKTLPIARELQSSFAVYQELRQQPLSFGIATDLIGVDEQSTELARELVIGLVAARKSGDALLRDVVSVVAQHAVESLSATRSAGLEHALLFVARFLFEDNLARRQSLEGEVHEAMGRSSAAITSWRAALAATDTTSHDYLTRVQTLWFAYLDAGLDTEADQLLARLPTGLRDQFHSEIDEALSSALDAPDGDTLRAQAQLPFGASNRPPVARSTENISFAEAQSRLRGTSRCTT